MTKALSFGVLALLLGASRAPAQAPPPPRPQQAPVAAPPPELRSAAPPPSTVAPARGRSATQAQAPTFAPIQPVASGSLPPDSVKPRTTVPAAEPPANAVAQCVDGTFVVAPNDAGACTTHRGVLVRMPRRTPPPEPAALAALPSAAALRAPLPATAPAGATMRCKDGTWLVGPPAEGRCSANGGVAAILMAPRSTPPPPAQPRRP